MPNIGIKVLFTFKIILLNPYVNIKSPTIFIILERQRFVCGFPRSFFKFKYREGLSHEKGFLGFIRFNNGYQSDAEWMSI